MEAKHFDEKISFQKFYYAIKNSKFRKKIEKNYFVRVVLIYDLLNFFRFFNLTDSSEKNKNEKLRFRLLQL